MNKEPVLLSTPGPYISNLDAAVVCAVGDGCSHLDCHFKVIVVGISGGRAFSCFYSSEANSWSDHIFDSGAGFGYCMMGSVLVGNTLCFRRGSSHVGEIITKYDFLTHEMHVYDSPTIWTRTRHGRSANCYRGWHARSCLCLWLREQGRLAESRVI